MDSGSKDKLMGQAKAARQRRKERFEGRNGTTAEQESVDCHPADLDKEAYETLVDSIPYATYSAFPGKTGPTTFISKKWQDWTGYSSEQLYQDSEAWPKCIHPDDKEGTVKAYAAACRDAVPYNLEYRLLHKDTGQLRHVKDQGFVSKDEEGSAIRVDGIITDVTESRWAQDALRESEERLRILFESAPDGIYLTDMDGNFVDLNKAAEEMAGRGKDELVGKNIAEIGLLSQAETMKAFSRLERTSAGEPAGPEEFTIRRKDGGEVAVEIRTFPVRMQGQTLSLGIARDITERKQAEEVRRESEAALNEAQKLAGIGSWSWIAETDTARWSRELYEIIGRDPQLPPPTYAEHSCFYTKESWDRLNEVVEKAVNEGLPYEVELDMVRPDGQMRHTSTRGQAVVNESGHVVRLHGTVQDITERKNAQQEIVNLSLFPEEAPDPVLRVSCDGAILYKNPAVDLVLEEEGLTEEDIHQIMPGDLQALVRRALYENKALKYLEVELSGRTYCYTLTPIAEHQYVNLYGRDITERKRAEQRILEDRAQLTSLASELSLTEERERHRLATELHDQIGQSLVFSKLKLDMLCESASSAELVGALEEVCNNLGQVIDDTRTLTFDLSSPILYELGIEAAMAEWLSDEIRDKHGLETEFEDDRQPKPLDDDIRTVLFRNARELLVNIVKHAQARKVKVCVRRVDGNIRIGIEDDGVGFDPVDVTSRAAKGAKFGLFSIRRRLEQLGGVIEIVSAPGRGSRISMTAPLKHTKASGDPKGPLPTNGPGMK